MTTNLYPCVLCDDDAYCGGLCASHQASSVDDMRERIGQLADALANSECSICYEMLRKGGACASCFEQRTRALDMTSAALSAEHVARDERVIVDVRRREADAQHAADLASARRVARELVERFVELHDPLSIADLVTEVASWKEQERT